MTPQQFDSLNNYFFLICANASIIIIALGLIQLQLRSIKKVLEETLKESRQRELMDLFTKPGLTESWGEEHMEKLGKRIKELLDEK